MDISTGFFLYLCNVVFLFQDEMISIHRNWTVDGERRIIPQNLHVQFHGREMHTLCFVSEHQANDLFSRSIWIATGCEDGTVRLTRYYNVYFMFRI